MAGLMTDDYRKVLIQKHRDGTAFGCGGRKSQQIIEGIMKDIEARTVLDYGCGKATLSKVMKGVRNFDPAMPEYADLPETADLVVCRDVMEHVEDECIDAVLDHINTLARKAAWFQIVFAHSGQLLPDGRNTHISVHDIGWWTEKLRARWESVKITQTRPKDAEFLCRHG